MTPEKVRKLKAEVMTGLISVQQQLESKIQELGGGKKEKPDWNSIFNKKDKDIDDSESSKREKEADGEDDDRPTPFGGDPKPKKKPLFGKKKDKAPPKKSADEDDDEEITVNINLGKKNEGVMTFLQWLESKTKGHEWKAGKGIKGTVRAALTHHPEKFSTDDPDKLNPYAIFSAKKKKGMESHYKDQKSTLKGKPKKKEKFKNEGVMSFTDWLDQKDEGFRTCPERGMEKINWKQSMSKKTRDIEDDLSKDYKGHIKMNGTVEPFKVLDKRTLRRS